VPATLVQLPESLDYLLAKRPNGALEKANRVRARLHLPPMTALPAAASPTEAQRRSGLLGILRAPFLTATLVTSLLYFFTMGTVYFLVSWTPKLLTQLGLSLSGGISGSVLMNISGTVGVILYGIYATRFGVRRLATVFMLGLALMTLVFGVVPGQATMLLATTLAVGFFLNASIAVLYMVVPAVFPAAVRATGTGFAMSMGRVGAVLGPFSAGLLMQLGFGRAVFCTALALPMLFAIACLYRLRALDRPAPALDRSRPRAA